MNRQLLKGHSTLLILAVLAKQPMHGYALSEFLKAEMDEAFRFGVGMIYPLLHQLEKERLVVGKWERWPGADRRVYSLTKKGQKQLDSKRAEWKMMAQLVQKLVHQAV